MTNDQQIGRTKRASELTKIRRQSERPSHAHDGWHSSMRCTLYGRPPFGILIAARFQSLLVERQEGFCEKQLGWQSQGERQY